MTISSEE